jgi:hypothetical protein
MKCTKYNNWEISFFFEICQNFSYNQVASLQNHVTQKAELPVRKGKLKITDLKEWCQLSMVRYGILLPMFSSILFL